MRIWRVFSFLIMFTKSLRWRPLNSFIINLFVHFIIDVSYDVTPILAFFFSCYWIYLFTVLSINNTSIRLIKTVHFFSFLSSNILWHESKNIRFENPCINVNTFVCLFRIFSVLFQLSPIERKITTTPSHRTNSDFQKIFQQFLLKSSFVTLKSINSQRCPLHVFLMSICNPFLCLSFKILRLYKKS